MPLLGAAVFLILMNIRLPKRLNCIAARFSICSFGIYLLHDMILMCLVQKIGIRGDKSAEVILLAVGTYILSYLIVEILSKIPRVGMLFLKKSK